MDDADDIDNRHNTQYRDNGQSDDTFDTTKFAVQLNFQY